LASKVAGGLYVYLHLVWNAYRLITSTSAHYTLFACIAVTQAPAEEAIVVPASPYPVVLCEESQRLPRTAHPCILVPFEMREETGRRSDDISESPANVAQIAIFCQPPSPIVARVSRSASPTPYNAAGCDSPADESAMTEAVAAWKRPVCARLSVPTDGPPRRRTTSGSGNLSRSQSHPLHRQRHRSLTPTTTNNLDDDDLALQTRRDGRSERHNDVLKHRTS